MFQIKVVEKIKAQFYRLFEFTNLTHNSFIL